MMQIKKEFLDIFDKNFDNNLKNYDEVIDILKNANATQIECVKVLMIKASLKLKEADNLVLYSKTWQKQKNNTIEFRNKFGETMDKFEEE